MTQYIRRTCDGSSPILLTDPEAAEILARPNVSDSYETDEPVGDDSVMVTAWEIYAEDETPEDWPDGDSYADAILCAPDGYHWTREGELEAD